MIWTSTFLPAYVQTMTSTSSSYVNTPLIPILKIKFDHSYGHNRSSKVCSMTCWEKFIFQQHPLLPLIFSHFFLPTIIIWLAFVKKFLGYVSRIGGTFSLSIVGWSKMSFHHLWNTIESITSSFLLA
jgi:hypothetical protein